MSEEDNELDVVEQQRFFDLDGICEVLHHNKLLFAENPVSCYGEKLRINGAGCQAPLHTNLRKR